MFVEAIRPKPRHVSLPALPETVGDGLWLLPSRAREQRAIATMRACADAGQTTPGLLIEDGCKYYIPTMPTNWSRLTLSDHSELAGALHAAFKLYPDKDWYGIISDGVRPVTRNWDRLLVAASQGKNFVSCNDDWRRDSRMAGILLVPGWVVRALGYFFPPGMVHLWTDDCWEQLAQELDNWVYVQGVTVKDHHFSHPDPNMKVAFDMPREYKGLKLHQHDRATYQKWRTSAEFSDAITRIKSAWVSRTGKEWGHA